jgi:hypothetical protein
MGYWFKDWKSWQGTAEELVATIAEVVGETPVPANEFAPNVRLLRHYQSIDAVDRPERRGKEAIYGYRHLLQTMVVRSLVLDSWPLAKIAKMTQGASDEELIQLLPDYGEGGKKHSNRAQRLVEGFAKDAMLASPAVHSADRALASRKRRSKKSGDKLVSRSSELSSMTRRRVTLDLEIAEWCRVTLDRGVLTRLKKEEIDDVAAKFREAIEMERNRERRRKQR